MDFKNKYLKYKEKYLRLKGSGLNDTITISPQTSPVKILPLSLAHQTSPVKILPLSLAPQSSPVKISSDLASSSSTPKRQVIYPFKLFSSEENIITDNIIPNETILYDNITSPHIIPMYREMVKMYLSLFIKFEGFNKAIGSEFTQLMDDNGKEIKYDPSSTEKYFLRTSTPQKMILRIFNPENVFILNPTFYFYDDKTNNITEEVILNNDVYSFEYLPISLNIDCFFTGCNLGYHRKAKVQICRNKHLLLIGFSIGTAYRNTEQLNSIEKFKSYLSTIKEILSNDSENNIKQLLLFGHSNGMNAATFTAFILQYLKNKESYTSYYSTLIHDYPTLFTILNEESLNPIWEKLRDIDIFVVGSGGTPMLFHNEDEFQFFYDSLNGKYLHLAAAKNTFFFNDISTQFPKTRYLSYPNPSIFVEPYLNDYTVDSITYKNYKFAIYSTAGTKSSKVTGFNNTVSHEFMELDEFGNDFHMFNEYLPLLLPYFYRKEE